MISLMIAIPLLFAFISIVFKGLAKYALPFIVLLNILILLIASTPVVENIGGWKAPFGISLVLDDASYYVVLVVNLIFLLLSLIPQIIDKGYDTIILLLLTSTNGLVLTGDLFNSFVFIEITAAAAYILAYHRNNPYGAFKYLIIGGISGSFYLLGTIFSYVGAGSLNMAHISNNSFGQLTAAIAILFILGLGVEAKLFPLAGWVPDVYASGSSLTPTILGTAITFSIMYLTGRIFITVLHGTFLDVLYILGLLTVIVGEVAALRQDKLLRALAYSSIAQAGLVVAAISLNNIDSLTGAYFHSMNDLTAKFILFPIATVVIKGFEEDRLAGFAFSVASFSLIGFPLFAGFRSKLLIISSAFSAGNYILPAVLFFASIVEAAYLLKWNIKLWFEKSDTSNNIPWNLKTIVLVLSILLLIIGIYPDLYLDASRKIAQSILDTQGYINSVLGGI
ncbi:MAG: NADH-quinone oxidoreductase subunit [Thermotogaceae bacterium]|nr:NADH-quinone oxidoreductase subunit [Thermotogaceae bacterium]